MQLLENSAVAINQIMHLKFLIPLGSNAGHLIGMLNSQKQRGLSLVKANPSDLTFHRAGRKTGRRFITAPIALD